MIKKAKYIIFCVLFLIIYSSGLSQEEKTKNLLIIMDSSRSMLQLTSDGKEKLWAAKIALNKLLDKLPNDISVALLVFGHREKNKCDDIEIVLQLAPLNKTIINKKLEPLKPVGVTPLMSSLDIAAKHLRKFEGKSIILLLTDGKETCGGNPVELVSNISKKYGIIVIVDVVGLNVQLIERAQLEAIAKAGGGNYYSANSSEELTSVIKEAVEQRMIEIDQYDNQTTEEQRVKKINNGEPGTLLINHTHILNSIVIYDNQTEAKADGQTMWIHSENQYSTRLEEGLYNIKIYSSSQETPIEIKNVRIKPNKKTTINVN